MKSLLLRSSIAALGLALAVPAAGFAQTTGSTFALLPLVAGDTGMPYQVFPTSAEREALGAYLERGIVRRNGGIPASGARVARALAAGGYDQNDAYKQCDDAACARKLGKAMHVDTVVFGSVTRAMAMIWGTEVSLVDVATGNVQGPYQLGSKGDYLALSEDVPLLAGSLSQTLIADAAARRRTVARH
jgi:hypothetical protein